MIQLNKLILETSNFIKKYGLSYFNDNCKLSPRNENSPWFKICQSCLGEYVFKESSYIRSAWLNNSKSIREKVMDSISMNEVCENSPENENNGKIKNMIVYFLEKEWIYLKDHIGGVMRKKFNIQFHRELTKKINALGLCCELKCKSNWFLKSKESIWKGSYTCSSCQLVLKAHIKTETLVNGKILVIIEYKNYLGHEIIKVQKRQTSAQRLKLAKNIMANGVCNVQAENFINNSKYIL